MGELYGEEASEYRRHRFLLTLVSGAPDGLEWLLGTLKIVFGGWLLMPFSTFATAPHLYHYAAQFPEKAWGALYLTLGILQWTAWQNVQHRARFWVGVLAAMLWDAYGYQIWRADHRAASLAFLTVIAAGQLLACIWLYPRAFPKKKAAQHDGN